MADPIANAMRYKRTIPEIDFTLHTMEDGAQVSTQERVCKGEKAESRSIPRLRLTRHRCPGACDASSE